MIPYCWACSSPVVYLENHWASGQRGDILAVGVPTFSGNKGWKTVNAELHGHSDDRMLMWLLIPTSLGLLVHTTHSHEVNGNLKPLRNLQEAWASGKTSHGTFHSAREATGIVKWPLRTMSRFVDSASKSRGPSRACVKSCHVKLADRRPPKVCIRKPKPPRRQVPTG